jgi:hypothetical protein
VIWENGDWRLALNDNGAQADSALAINTIDGFVPMGPGVTS